MFDLILAAVGLVQSSATETNAHGGATVHNTHLCRVALQGGSLSMKQGRLQLQIWGFTYELIELS
jgi:hypothetical protein